MNTNDTNSTPDSSNSANTEPTTPVSGATPVESSAAPEVTTPAVPAVEAAVAPTTVGEVVAAAKALVFKAVGLVKGSIDFQAGAKVKDLIKKINEDISTSSISIRDITGKPVGLERALTESLEVSVVQKAAGG